MSRPVVEAELDGYGSLVRGWQARDLVLEVTGRAPVWSHHRRGWSVQEHTAGQVVSLATDRGYDVVCTRARSAQKARLLEVINRAVVPECFDPGEGRW